MTNEPHIRFAILEDLQGITDIYNHYVESSAATFDIRPWKTEERIQWFEQFTEGSSHQCWVLVDEHKIFGYACSTPFRPKPAYNTSVESTIYLDPSALGKGYGQQLYKHLFKELNKLQLNRCYGIVTLPNHASVQLHESLGFETIGTLTEVGFKFSQYWDTVWMEKKLGTAQNSKQAL